MFRDLINDRKGERVSRRGLGELGLAEGPFSRAWRSSCLVGCHWPSSIRSPVTKYFSSRLELKGRSMTNVLRGKERQRSGKWAASAWAWEVAPSLNLMSRRRTYGFNDGCFPKFPAAGRRTGCFERLIFSLVLAVVLLWVPGRWTRAAAFPKPLGIPVCAAACSSSAQGGKILVVRGRRACWGGCS